MKIQILGTGCPKCKMLEQHTLDALRVSGIRAEVEKVTDLNEIMNMGVMLTPALAVDGTVKSTGKVLSKDQIVQMLKEKN
ncbi:MAG: thioredoxin family protein [Spirochaeta sp.]|nr:thioredoxin family protein [Spirochaeta sp.]